MASGSCFCGGGLSNLALFSCANNPKVTKKSIFVPKYGSDGSLNGIPSEKQDPTAWENGKLKESYILGKLDAPDGRDRWYLTPDLYEEVTSTRTDRIQETAASGTTRTLANGVPQFEARLWDAPQAWSANLNSASCQEMTVYSMDAEGSLVGESSTDKTFYYGLPIEKNTLNAEFFPATDTTGAYTVVTYQIEKTVDEGRIITLSSQQIEPNLLTARGLIDIVLTEGTGSTATNLLVLAESDIYGNFNDYEALEGATVTTDWTVLDGTTPVIVSTATEDQTASDYNYDLTIPSTPTTDLTVSYLKTRTSVSEFGFISNTITITTPA